MCSIRIVTSVYKDLDILNEWINNLNVPSTVYVKDDALQKNESIIINDKYIRLCNYGRCDYAFLYHIIKNYDCLDDRIIFTKANWHYTGLNLYKIIATAQLYDFVESGCGRKWQFWKPQKDLVIHNNIELMYTSEPDHYAESAMDLYKTVFGEIEPPDMVEGWGHFPCFCVSKKLILRHPKSVYEKLLMKFYPESGCVDMEKVAKHPGNLNTYDKLVEDLGKLQHDRFGRFWYILFTHNLGSLDAVIADRNM
jgi:Protein of unknown function (DUF3431)